MITNPPFGVSWKSDEDEVKADAQTANGRFSVGTPRSSDGVLIFLQHMLSKMEYRGSRVGIVFNGSPLFIGDASSSESNIRKWIVKNDWLECIIALPEKLFFNASIATFIWILSNKNPKPDTKQRDYERVPLSDDIEDYYQREVKPHVPDSWLDRKKDKVGYEINFNRYFYQDTPLRSLKEIADEILALEQKSEGLLNEVLGYEISDITKSSE